MPKNLLLIAMLGLLVSISVAQEPDLFPIHKGAKYGYIDHTGNVVIPLTFDDAWPFSEGLAPVRVGPDWGYLDKFGKFAIRPRFFDAWQFSEGFARVGIYWPGRKIVDSTVGYDGYINKNGEVITKDRFGVGFSFSDGLAQIQTENYKNGFIDQTGKIVLYADSYGTKFSDGRALFKTNGNMPDSRAGFIDKSGKIVIPATYRDVEEFSEGLACVYNDQNAGFVDASGKVVIDFRYENCGSFSEGLASILINGFVGFIDKSAKIVIPPRFTWNPGAESHFSDGVAVVQVGEGEKPTETGVRDVTLAQGNIYANMSGRFGVIDKTGTFIIQPRYVQIGDFHNGLAWVNLSDSYIIHGDTDRWGYINKQGKIVWKSF